MKKKSGERGSAAVEGGVYGAMDVLERYYDEQAFMLYGLIARVPGRSAGLRKLFVTFSILILIVSTVFQVNKFVTSGWQVEVMIDILPTISASFMCLVYALYLTFASQKNFTAILSMMLNDLREPRSEEEGAIKGRYARGAKIFINAYKFGFTLSLCGMPLTGFIPYFLDLIIPLNETRERELIYQGDIFIDQNKYFYLIYFVESCSVLVVCVFIGVSEIISVIIGQHCCGMFAEVGYRLENITRVKEEQMSPGDFINLRLVQCIKKHQQVLTFADYGVEFYDIPLTLILIETFCALTVALVQVSDPKLISAKMVIFTSVEILQFFIICVMGQNIMDASVEFSMRAYNTEWDVFPGKMRKLLQFILRKSSEPCVMMARGIYRLTIESFMSIMQTITSFYMVLRQTQ